MSGQMSDNTVQASHSPPDLTEFGLLCRSPLFTHDSSQDKKKTKKKLFLHLILLFKSIFSSASKGTDSQVVGIKTR